MKEIAKFTVVDTIVKILRKECLSRAHGELLGSEDEMLERYKASRPTFKQAAKLVAQEQLLSIRRGVGGGYYVNRPQFQTVAESAAIYLQTKNVTLEEVFVAIIPLRTRLSRLAAMSTDPDARQALEDFYRAEDPDQHRDLSRGIFNREEYKAYLKSEVTFTDLLCNLAKNEVLSLLVRVLHDFIGKIPREDDIFRVDPTRVVTYAKLRRKLTHAILDSEPDVAALLATRLSDTLSEWLREDLQLGRIGDGSRASSSRLMKLI